MEMIIITGMSGAGKSRAMNTLEDIGFYCVDNMPAKLIGKFAELAAQSEEYIPKMAVAIDARGGNMFNDLSGELDVLDANDYKYKMLFLDCDDTVLMRRYKETRRKHPLLNDTNVSVDMAIKAERKLLSSARARADYVIDTTFLTSMQLKEKIIDIFASSTSEQMLISCMSFGFKYGYPSEADLVFDVRCLPNPFYIDELKHKTGINSEVSDYVMSFEESKQLEAKLFDLVDFLIPLYIKEGKSQLVIAFGCTGGRHRSVTFAENMQKHILESYKKVTIQHRDINK